jgi:hypothetical protein
MGIISKQIGWSNEANLLWEILKQINKLKSTIFGLKPKYKIVSGLINQDFLEPTFIITENTLGNIGSVYGGSGLYYITSDNLFTPFKTTYFIQPTTSNNPQNAGIYISYVDASNLQVEVILDGVGQTDGFLNNCPFEIKVYN